MAFPNTENTLWRLINKNLPGPQWTRIETGQTGRGVPDLEGCWDGQSVWVELKIVRSGKIKLTMNQANWHRARDVVGGRSVILASDPKKNKLCLWRGCCAMPLFCDPDTPPETTLPGPLNGESWRLLRDHLFRGTMRRKGE